MAHCKNARLLIIFAIIAMSLACVVASYLFRVSKVSKILRKYSSLCSISAIGLHWRPVISARYVGCRKWQPTRPTMLAGVYVITHHTAIHDQLRSDNVRYIIRLNKDFETVAARVFVESTENYRKANAWFTIHSFRASRLLSCDRRCSAAWFVDRIAQCLLTVGHASENTY